MERRRLWLLPGMLGLGLGACAPQPQTVVVLPTRTCDTSFTVVNNSTMTVERLYFSHSSINSWGVDQLGANVLPPGRAWNYRAANAGNYDFRVIWNNGQEAQIRNVNVCVASRIRVTNSGLSAS